MIREFIHYVVREGSEARHECLVAGIFKDLRRNDLDGVTFTVYRLGNLYIHLTCFSGEADRIRFENLQAIADFDTSIDDLLLEEPIINDYIELDTYSSCRS